MTRTMQALRTLANRHWHGMILVTVLAGLALVSPQVNAAAGPPSSVFVSWPEDQPVPELRITAHQYADGGWYIDLAAAGFAFSDLCQAVDGPQTIGHAHVYQGERKVTSAFVPRVSLGHLRPGRHAYRVQLRAQDHRALVGPDGIIAATIVIEVEDAGGA